jgi:4-alpha-glucanotransferase
VFDEIAKKLVRQSVVFHRWQGLATWFALTQDVTVSFRRGGADAWLFQDLVLDEFELGAPPDALARGGQRWGLAVANPLANAVTDDLDLATALPLYRAIGSQIRLDHVLGLRRRFAYRIGEVSGAYIQAEGDREIAHVAQITQQLGLEVVGEDLGRVPGDFRALLRRHEFAGLDVPYFMQPIGRHVTLDPGRVLATSTFDLPTLTGILSGADAVELRRLGRVEEATFEARMIVAMERALGVPPGSFQGSPNVHDGVTRALSSSWSLSRRVMLRSLWVMAEDLLGVEQRANIPGSRESERENWLGEIQLDWARVRTNLRTLMTLD